MCKYAPAATLTLPPVCTLSRHPRCVDTTQREREVKRLAAEAQAKKAAEDETKSIAALKLKDQQDKEKRAVCHSFSNALARHPCIPLSPHARAVRLRRLAPPWRVSVPEPHSIPA